MRATNQLWKNAELVPSSEHLLEQMLNLANIQKVAGQVIRNESVIVSR